MLSAQAYSFRLKSRLAISLSWVGGYTNVIALIACHETVSHVTGNTTHLGMSVGDAMLRSTGALEESAKFLLLIGLFLGGAICSGVMTESARRAGRASKYILPMTVEGILLCIVALLLLLRQPSQTGGEARWANVWTVGIAAFAMGLQNATITKISGSVVRTTHLTGVVTDLGLELVQLTLWWRDQMGTNRLGRFRRAWQVSRRQPSVLRAALLASIFSSFMFGAGLGTVLFTKLGPSALLAPVFFLAAMVVIDYTTPIADVREIDPTLDSDLGPLRGHLHELLPPHVGIFRLAHHRNRSHHAPDFSTWVERVPRHWRVIILVISPLTQFNIDTAASLLSAVQTLKSGGRTLIISGMNRIQFKTLMDSGIAGAIEIENFVPDLEFAVARGINLTE